MNDAATTEVLWLWMALLTLNEVLMTSSIQRRECSY